MSADKSDFMKRLQAMREGQQPEAAKMPSLKERLQAKSPGAQKSMSSERSNAADAIKARIQAKFNQKQTDISPTADEQNALRNAANRESNREKTIQPSVSTPSEPEVHIELEKAELPTSQRTEKKDKTTDKWTPENGGSCVDCGTYNMGHVVFCGDCGTMLLKTAEEKLDIISSYPLKEIRGLVHTFVDKLAKLNVQTTEDLLRVGTRRANRSTLTKQSGMSERSLVRLLHQADFCRIPSMDPESVALLELVGIQTLAEFKAEKPGGLYKKIQQAKIKLNQAGIMFLPTKSKVSVWLEEALTLSEINIQ